MSRRFKLLDLFCGAGGAAQGYHLAGFEVVGVDIAPQPHYPFEFYQANALEYVAEHGREFDVIHASPPCQAYCSFRRLNEALGRDQSRHPDLIAATRAALRATGSKVYVIENVPNAPLIEPILLCGEMFGLRVFRHRLFEVNRFLLAPPHPRHPRGSTTNAYRGVSAFVYGATHISVAGNNFRLGDAKAAMGIDWDVTRREISQMIPPAYTRWLGGRLMEILRREGS